MIFILAGKSPQLTADFQEGPVSQVATGAGIQCTAQKEGTNLKTKQIYKKQHMYKKRKLK